MWSLQASTFYFNAANLVSLWYTIVDTLQILYIIEIYNLYWQYNVPFFSPISLEYTISGTITCRFYEEISVCATVDPSINSQ